MLTFSKNGMSRATYVWNKSTLRLPRVSRPYLCTSVRQFRSPPGRGVSSPKKGSMSAQVGPRKVLLFGRERRSVKRAGGRGPQSGRVRMRDLPRSVFLHPGHGAWRVSATQVRCQNLSRNVLPLTCKEYGTLEAPARTKFGCQHSDTCWQNVHETTRVVPDVGSQNLVFYR